MVAPVHSPYTNLMQAYDIVGASKETVQYALDHFKEQEDLPMKRLTRSRTDRKIAGVCAGIANSLGLDPTLVRLGWAILALAAGSGVLAYLVCALVIPEE